MLADAWGLSTNGKALVIASGFAGMFFGAITLADYVGRRRLLIRQSDCAVDRSARLHGHGVVAWRQSEHAIDAAVVRRRARRLAHTA